MEPSIPLINGVMSMPKYIPNTEVNKITELTARCSARLGQINHEVYNNMLLSTDKILEMKTTTDLLLEEVNNLQAQLDHILKTY